MIITIVTCRFTVCFYKSPYLDSKREAVLYASFLLFINMSMVTTRTGLAVINGVTCIDPSKMTITLNDVSISDAGRDETGYMNPGKIGWKWKFQLQWNYISQTNATQIISALQTNETFNFTTRANVINPGTNLSVLVYCGDRALPMYNLRAIENEPNYSQLTVDLIQVDMNAVGCGIPYDGTPVFGMFECSPDGNTWYCAADPSKADLSLMDISDSEAGNDQFGYMHKMFVCRKHKLEMAWQNIKVNEAAAILRQIGYTETFYVYCSGTMIDGIYTDGYHVYCGDRTVEVIWYPQDTSKQRVTVSVDFIEL